MSQLITASKEIEIPCMETKLFCITSTLLKIPDLTETEERNNGLVGKTDF